MTTFLNYAKEILNSLKNFVIPPDAFSWQIFIWLSVFSCIASALATTTFVQELIASFGWIFLIIGVGWFTKEYEKSLTVGGVPLGPWITGALISLFLFGQWFDRVPELVFVSWPPISAMVAALGDFLGPYGKFKIPPPPARQRLVVLILLNLVFSCWFYFYFVVQDWLTEYPSLLLDDFSDSAFVMQLAESTDEPSRGMLILDLAESQLKTEVEGKPWPDVERWLLNLRQQPDVYRMQVLQQLSRSPENQFWDLQAQILPDQPEYALQLLAVWRGPSSRPKGYYLVKSCQINPIQLPTNVVPVVPAPPPQTTTTASPTPSPTPTGEVTCGAVSSRLWL